MSKKSHGAAGIIVVSTLLFGCSDSPECGSADSIDAILEIVAEERLIPIYQDPGLSAAISTQTFERSEEIFTKRSAALQEDLESVVQSPLLTEEYITSAVTGCVDHVNKKYQGALLTPLTDQIQTLEQDLAQLETTAPTTFDQQGVESAFEKISPPPPLEPYEWSQWDAHQTAKARYVDEHAQEWQKQVDAYENATSMKRQELDAKQRSLESLTYALQNEVPALCTYQAPGGELNSSSLPPEILQEIQAYIEAEIAPRINEQETLFTKRNSLESEIESIRMDAVSEVTQEITEILENPEYELQNIITRSVNKDTGAVACKAEITTEFSDFDPVLSEIEYTIEKTSDGDDYATVTSVF